MILHQPYCTCGWHGRAVRDAAAAQSAAQRHVFRCVDSNPRTAVGTRLAK